MFFFLLFWFFFFLEGGGEGRLLVLFTRLSLSVLLHFVFLWFIRFVLFVCLLFLRAYTCREFFNLWTTAVQTLYRCLVSQHVGYRFTLCWHLATLLYRSIIHDCNTMKRKESEPKTATWFYRNRNIFKAKYPRKTNEETKDKWNPNKTKPRKEW